MSMGSGKQVVRPPQRGIFPLDHLAECSAPMQAYLDCLSANSDQHHRCRDYSRDYLQCRMDAGLMAEENLDQMGFGENQRVHAAKEYDGAKEKAGFVAGKHIQKDNNRWWWQRAPGKSWWS